MRRWRMIAAAGLMAVGGIAVAASPASARGGHFTGNAPGSVTCSMAVRVKFLPRHDEFPGSRKRSPESSMGAQPAIRLSPSRRACSRGTGAFGQSALNCGNPVIGPTSFSVTWKGKFNGPVGGGLTFTGKATYLPSVISLSSESMVTNVAGDAGLALPGAGNTSTVDQSFSAPGPTGSSGVLYTAETPAALATMCSSSGIHILSMTGTVTIG